VHRLETHKTDEAALAAEAAFVAGILPSAEIRLSVRDKPFQAKRIVAAAKARFDIARPFRLSAVARDEGPPAVVEVILGE
jgi:hypothetical protein